MSKKKENQFMCSSMMLPEHREKLTEHHKKTAEGKKPTLPEDQTREELAHYLNQSLHHQLPVEIRVVTDTEIRSMRGIIVGSQSREGTLKLRIGRTVTVVRLDAIAGCRLASKGLTPE